MKEFICKICDKKYSSIQSLCNHNKKFHNNECHNNCKCNKCYSKKVPLCVIESIIIKNKYLCKHCYKGFGSRQSRWTHEKKFCKQRNIEKIIIEPDNNEIVKKNLIIPNLINSHIFKKDFEVKSNYPINNQLINIIVDKSKTIEALKTKIEDKDNIIANNLIKISNETQIKMSTLILNNIIIISRNKDNYINATQLCLAGNKDFNDWFCLNSTKQLINEVMNETHIDISLLVDVKKESNNNITQLHEIIDTDSWIHPNLAIYLAQWISPKFYLQVGKWTRTLLTNVLTNAKLLEDHRTEIKLKDHKIQLLEDSFIKKQKRKDYPDKNVIYMLTTEDNKKKRNYIIGKAIVLKNRLSAYNKTSEHEVIYYKSSSSIENMNACEILVLNKLKLYKEKANRDRFILPEEKDILFFTNIIDECINFVNS